MRISSQQVFDSGVSSMQQHTSDVVKYQQQISSGRKYQVASDDALAAGLGVQIDLDNTQFAMFKVNQNHITASLTSTDSQLMNINLALTNFQQMMVQAGNGTLGARPQPAFRPTSTEGGSGYVPQPRLQAPGAARFPPRWPRAERSFSISMHKDISDVFSKFKRAMQKKRPSKLDGRLAHAEMRRTA